MPARGRRGLAWLLALLATVSAEAHAMGGWNGWGVSPSNTRFQSAAVAGLTADSVGHLALKWAFGFPGASMAFSQPAVADGAVFVGSEGGTVYALDAHTGTIRWSFKAGNSVRTGFVIDGGLIYFGDQHGAWRAPNLLDPEKGGGLFALRVSDGASVWKALPSAACSRREHCSPAQLAAATAIPGLVFSGSLDGHLRAYSSRSGRVLWDYDTAREFSTVNHVSAHGGSLNGAGAAVAAGMVFVNSGYDRFGEAPGNVLLAFGTQSN